MTTLDEDNDGDGDDSIGGGDDWYSHDPTTFLVL